MNHRYCYDCGCPLTGAYCLTPGCPNEWDRDPPADPDDDDFEIDIEFPELAVPDHD